MKVFEYTRVSKNNKSFKKMTALVISDLHIANEKDLKTIKKLSEINMYVKAYDVVFVVGDILDSTAALENTKVKDALLTFFRDLGWTVPVYVAFGSHDYGHYDSNLKKWYNDTDNFKFSFKNIIAGYHNVYVDEKTHILPNGDTVSIINPSYNYAVNNKDGDNYLLIKEQEKFNYLKNLSPDKTNTLLCHYPNVVKELAKTDLLDNVDISICGHTHNGMTQLRVIPVEGIMNFMGAYNRGIITPSKSMNLDKTKYLRGNFYLDNNNDIIINPAFNSLSATNGKLQYLNSLFYKGVSFIDYTPESVLEEENEEFKRKLNRK